MNPDDHHLRKFVRSLLGATIALGFLGACNRDEGKSAFQSTVKQAPALHDNMSFKFAGNPEKTERIKFPEFSVVAPQGENWIEGPRRPEPISDYYDYQPRIQFFKIVPQTKFGPQSILAQVSIAHIHPNERPIIAANVRDYMWYRMNMQLESDRAFASGRMRLRSESANLDETLGACFRLDAVAEDRGVFGYEDSIFLIHFHAYECVTPSLNYMVRIEYSQRVPPDVEPVDVTREGEDFLKTLTLGEPEG